MQPGGDDVDTRLIDEAGVGGWECSQNDIISPDNTHDYLSCPGYNLCKTLRQNIIKNKPTFRSQQSSNLILVDLKLLLRF